MLSEEFVSPVVRARGEPLEAGQVVRVGPARVHDVGTISPMLDERRDQGGWMLEVAVHCDGYVAPRAAKPGGQGVLVAEIAREHDRTDAVVAGGVRFDLGRRPVRAAVVHEEDLVGLRAEGGLDRLDERPDVGRLVVDGHDDADESWRRAAALADGLLDGWQRVVGRISHRAPRDPFDGSVTFWRPFSADPSRDREGTEFGRAGTARRWRFPCLASFTARDHPTDNLRDSQRGRG